MDNLINHFSVKTAKEFFFKKFDKFSEDSEDFSDLLKDDRFSDLEKIGEATFDNGDDMLMFTCKSSVLLTERSSKKSQYEIAKQMMKHERMDSAIAIFYDAVGNFRFSLVRRNHGNKEEKFSTYKRYTYFVTKDQKNKTFRQRIDIADFSSLDKIQEAFNVDKLTKQFYDELFNWYLWALSEEDGFSVKYPNDTAFDEDNRRIEEHLIRLITRLIFVWFIRRKKLIPDEIFNTQEISKILDSFNPESKTEGNYYNAILQNLFFACLNNPIEDRKFSTEDSFKGIAVDYGVKNLFRDNKKKSWFKISKDEVVDIFKQVPFLNGGLFECLDKITETNKMLYYDGFSRDEKTKDGTLKRAFVPNALFFDKNKGLITILERYNFTVEENSVDDVEVALDPELLGKVFENLLAAYNPETKETARKQTGSFYTPREIVDFMVDQSLIQYLITHNPDIPKVDFEEFVLKKSIPGSFKTKKIQEIANQIKSVKILDPACGSGAYPMGILTRLYELLTLLGGSSDNHYENKLTLIENCIYGVDIQSIAVQISKLRFFISLIVEQTPNSNIQDNYGIKSLPNLETKFVAANTLIGLKQNSKDQLDLNDDDLLKMKEELWDIRNHQNFRARSFKEKKELRKKDKELCNKIKKYIHKTAGGPNQAKIAQNLAEIEKAEEKIKNLPVIMVDVTESFTQTSMFDDDRPKTPSMFRKDANEEERNKLLKSIASLKKEIEFEKSKKGNVDTEEADNLISWDPYDQNASSPFFDPEWMFGLENFDIVIGNPPYIQLQKDGGKLAKDFQDCGYKTFARTGDIYSLFYEKGWQLLKPQGVLCYITSNKWMRAGYGENTREFFVNHTNPLILIDFAGQKIFESATVDTNILLFTRSENQHQTYACTVKEKVLNKLSDYFKQNSITTLFRGSEYWTILSVIEKHIKEKIEKIGIPLKDWNIAINYGIKTGFNDAFIISEQTRQDLIKDDPKSEEIIRPLLRGRDIKKYKCDFADLYLLYVPWHFPLQNDSKITGASVEAEKAFCLQYPAVYSHLLKYKQQLQNRNKAETGIRYEWYALQRWGANYWEDFSKQKIVWKRVGSITRFCFDNSGALALDSTCFATGENIKFLVCYLNSKIGKYLLKDSPKTGTGDLLISVQAIEPILAPIPSKHILKEFDEIFENQLAGTDCEKIIDKMIFDSFELTTDEIEFIENQIK